MVGELIDTENSGNKEKQTKTTGTRQMKREKSALAKTKENSIGKGLNSKNTHSLLNKDSRVSHSGLVQQLSDAIKTPSCSAICLVILSRLTLTLLIHDYETAASALGIMVTFKGRTLPVKIVLIVMNIVQQNGVYSSTPPIGDRMWHFARSMFLIELYGHNLLLTAVFGLVVAGSVLIFGVLIGDWIDRKPRNKVARASLFTQNASVTACCVVLMLVFSYRREMEQIWPGWFTVACYAVVIALAALANLAGTAVTITIQRDWIVSLTGDNRGQLAGMNAALRRLDQIINIFAPLSVGQVMAWASHVIGCGFILGWNLVSLLVEFLFLSRVYQLVPQLAVKPQQQTGGHILEMQQETVNIQGGTVSWETTDGFINKHRTLEKSKDQKSNLKRQKATTLGFLPLLHNMRRLLCACLQGWEAYCRQTVFLAGLGLAFLYMTVLGFDCITTGYAYTQGIGASLLSILTALSAVCGLTGTVLFTRLRRHYGLVTTRIISSWLHIGCLMLCVFSVFAPGSPFDLAVFLLSLSKNSSSNHVLLKEDEVHVYPFERNLNQPIVPDRSSIHWTNSMVLFKGQQQQPESYVSTALLFSGVILARIGLWSFDLTVTQLLQENVPEAERGAVNGVQCSLNYFMDLIHFILVMLAPRPQQFGLLVFISMLFVTTGHALYFFYARKCKIKNAHAKKTTRKGTGHL
ncbi:PREDICTED: solute carrier family 40 member 1-like [Galeopterus variegatus]|uniref:Solute carrier family 40 member 1-like n=1 Tax=Galeopterus variegatus TaxID=482537 RepID=A0ABM0QA66_GALVR|nr:PREDICTED: solute carrier family 40 member 1-like [Galeopterus variegatus]